MNKTMNKTRDSINDSLTIDTAKRRARIAGVLYLLVAIFGGFAAGLVYPSMYVSGNAAETAGNVIANPDLVRIGVVADLIQATILVFLGMTFYWLLKHVHKAMATAMLVLVAIATTIMCLNAVFEFAGLRIATDSTYQAAFGAAGSNALVLLLVDIQHYGFLIAQIFFGLWLLPLGYLAYKSEWFPRVLGALLIAGGVCYILHMLTAFLIPELSSLAHVLLGIPPTIAELSMLGYLLVIGVRSGKPSQQENTIRATTAAS